MTLREIVNYTYKEFPDSCFKANNSLEDLESYSDEELVYFIDDVLSCFENDNGGLALCSCGVFEDVRFFLIEILKSRLIEDYDARTLAVSKLFNCEKFTNNALFNGIYQFTLHVLEKADFVAHGSSVYGSWLTERGKIYLELAEIYFKEQEKKEQEN